MTTKNTVLKFSPYTAALTRSLKGCTRIHCNVDADGMVYVCNGYFAVKLTGPEYDALVRPVTQRDPGNWALEENGELSPNPMDLAEALAGAAREAVHELTPAPFLCDPRSKSSKAKIVLYYSKDGDFTAGFNSDYAAVIDPGLPRKTKNPASPMVIYSGDEPRAMIMPIRLGSKENPSRVPAAVRAYFAAPEKKSKSVERLINEVAALEKKTAQQEQENAELRRQLSELRQRHEQELAALEELLASQPAPAKENPAAETPAEKAAALVEQLATLEGVAATVKGAHTAAPVVWLEGKTAAHKKKIESLGGKWSSKRSAWYIKVA